MDQQTIVGLAELAVFSGGSILILVLVVHLLQQVHPTSLTAKDVIAFVEAQAQKGIWDAEKAAADLLATVGTDLTGADKKKIADSTYALWPNTVWLLGRSWPVGEIKVLVSQAQWEVIVQQVFDKGAAELAAARAFLLAQVGVAPLNVIAPPPLRSGMPPVVQLSNPPPSPDLPNSQA